MQTREKQAKIRKKRSIRYLVPFIHVYLSVKTTDQDLQQTRRITILDLLNSFYMYPKTYS